MSQNQMNQRRRSFIVLSDFNAQNLASLLSKGPMAIGAEAAPFGQVMQTLLASDADAWPPHLDGAIVWTSPQAVSINYRCALEYDGEIELEQMRTEVSAFAHALKHIPAHIRHIFVATWAPLHPAEGRRGMLDMNLKLGIAAALMRMNLELAEALADDSRITLFDSSRWLGQVGVGAYDARLWYLSKTPFALPVFKAAARDFTAALRGLQGGARKLLVVDLDNTLWGGVVGEVGWPELRLGGHDATGEAYRDFQYALRALIRRGILLAVVSKNEEDVALEAINAHPEMILRLSDLAGWRINWDDKARNVAELAAELNLGLDAVVFIDDHPVERARVREALPEVLVPEWPDSPLNYTDALRALDCFDAPAVSNEDRGRTAMYASERERQQLRREVPSLELWLRELNLTVRVEELARDNLERAAQLLNKTNQMNLRTRRLSSHELMSWAARPDCRMLVFRVADKFGDYGLTGMGGLETDRASRAALIADFILSCRVMGRQVERAMLHVLAECASAAGAAILRADYAATAKNHPCLRFFESCGMERLDGGATFQWNLREAYAMPENVTLIWPGASHRTLIKASATA